VNIRTGLCQRARAKLRFGDHCDHASHAARAVPHPRTNATKAALRCPSVPGTRCPVLWAWGLLALAAGCTALDLHKPPVADVAEQRQRRTDEALREFQSQRDLAEFQAASADWARGDARACKEGLGRLLERNPQHAEARLLMAEVCLADDQTQAACDQVRQALLARPRDAHVQYAAGLLLGAAGQTGGALACYARAAELEPDNELYAVSYQTALGADEPGEASLKGGRGKAEGGKQKPRPLCTLRSNASALSTQDSAFDSSQGSGSPAVVVPDPTAQPAELASTLARARPNRAKAAVPADQGSPKSDPRIPDEDTRGFAARGSGRSPTRISANPQAPSPPLVLRRASPRKTTDRVDSADSAGADQTGEEKGTGLICRNGPEGASHKSDLSPFSCLEQGRRALAEGSGEAALTCFQSAGALCPNDPQIPIAAAMAALRHDRPDLAVELLGSAQPRFAGSAQLHRILGVAYYRLGDYHSSQVALRQALSLDKSSALSYFLMGCTLSKLGQLELAEAHLRQAQTINPRYTARR
jgi:tetratricopeptide (TPR) repeat protein